MNKNRKKKKRHIVNRDGKNGRKMCKENQVLMKRLLLVNT